MPFLPFELDDVLFVSSLVPLELFDPVPGNIGLLGDSVIMIRFDEPAGVLARDEAERLNDLGVEAGIVAPALVDTFCGVGREFSQTSRNALIAKDRIDISPSTTTMLPRDVSICALISLTLAGATGPQTIIARGVNDGTLSERYAYGLEVEQQADNPEFFDVRLFWSDASGTIVTAPAGAFQHIGDGKEIMLTATRRIDSGTVFVRYYVDSRMIADVEVVGTTISGGVTGSTTFAGRKSAGTWDRFLNGTIDELQVVGRELSADEIRCTWERLTVHQPAGLAAFMGLAPPGASWFANPSSDIAKRAKVVGQAIGLFMAHVEEFRSTFLPGKCSAWLLPKWEELYAVSPMPLDSLDLRRARILARMAADEGYSIPALQAAFSLLFGLDPADVEILEGTNEWTDSFDGATITAERWQAGSVGNWSIDSGAGALQLDLFDSLTIAQSPTLGQCRLWTPLDRTDGGQVYFAAQIVDHSDLNHGTFTGMMLHRRVGNHTLWFGLYNNGTTIDLVTCEGTAGGGFTAITTIHVGVAGVPIWLRINMDAAGTGFGGADSAPVTLSWSTTSATAGFTDFATTCYAWYDLAGFGAYTTLATTVECTPLFDDVHVFVPEGLAPFAWFAYRDPALAGSFDLINANILARKVSPAHMYGAACASKRFLWGDPVAGLFGSVPMGTP